MNGENTDSSNAKNQKSAKLDPHNSGNRCRIVVTGKASIQINDGPAETFQGSYEFEITLENVRYGLKFIAGAIQQVAADVGEKLS